MNAVRMAAVCLAGLVAPITAACSGGDGDGPGGGVSGNPGSAGSAGATSGGSAGKGSGGSSGGTGGHASGAGGALGGSAGKAGGGSDTGGSSAGEAGGGGEGGEEPVMIDCSALPTAPLAMEELQGPKAFHDIAFDAAGNLIGSDNEALLKTALGGKPKVFVAGIGGVEGMDTLPNGDVIAIAVANETFETALVRITTEGGQQPITSLEYGGYGVRVGPDGFVYVATMNELLRVDPVTGNTQTVAVDMEYWAPRVIDYSPDKKKLYVGAQGDYFPEEPIDDIDDVGETGEGGLIYVFDLDDQGAPKGFPKLFAKNVGDGWVDGLSVDACGNLFVAEYFSTALYRVTPDGKSTLFKDWNDIEYGHGIEWGNGVGGFEKTSLYLPQPYDENTVVRVDVGVPQRPR